MRYASGNDERVRRRVLPVRIVKTWGEVENAQALGLDVAGEAHLGAFHGCVMRKGAAILLDFGEEFHGTLRLTVKGADQRLHACVLRIRFGESVCEALAPLEEKNAGNDHATRDRELFFSHLSTMETNESGFRFAYVQLAEGERAELLAVQGVEIVRNLSYIGSFECSDERLNRIWQVAARTTHLCMQDYLWDGIKRDRLVWMGDMHTEVMTILSLFGRQNVVPKSLDFLKSHTPATEWMNTMPSYSLWWVIVNRDWYLYTGDRAYLMAQRDYLRVLAARLTGLVDADGCERMPGKFLDWPTSENPVASHEGMQGLLKMALDAAGEMLGEMGDDELAAQCAQAAQRMQTHVPKASGSKGAAAILAISGVGDAAKANSAVIAPGGARGYSCFMGGYIMEAKALAGDVAGALDDARAFWGGMLDMGATTFWEDFSLDWLENAAPIDEIVPPGKKDIHGDFGAYCYLGFRHSLCHGWSSGPAWFFIKRVLGIRPLAPGFARAEIAPNLGDLAWAKGSIPTPHGVIRVSVRKKADGTLDTRVQAPLNIEIVRK